MALTLIPSSSSEATGQLPLMANDVSIVFHLQNSPKDIKIAMHHSAS